LLAQSESEFFDESLLDESDVVYAQYLTHRASVVNEQSNLRLLQTTLRTLLDSAGLTQLAQNTNLSLSSADQNAAQKQAEYAQSIGQQNTLVSSAQLSSLYAERSLAKNVAPFSGLVAEVFVEEGDYVQPGAALMKLVGVSGYEVSVRVPIMMLPLLEVGQVFVVDGVSVGAVSRFSPAVSQGSIEVFIELRADNLVTGQTIAGAILLGTDDASIVAIPRSYIHFTTQGTYIELESGTSRKIDIMYDASDMLYVKVYGDIDTPLKAVTGIKL